MLIGFVKENKLGHRKDQVFISMKGKIGFPVDALPNIPGIIHSYRKADVYCNASTKELAVCVFDYSNDYQEHCRQIDYIRSSNMTRGPDDAYSGIRIAEANRDSAARGYPGTYRIHERSLAIPKVLRKMGLNLLKNCYAPYRVEEVEGNTYIIISLTHCIEDERSSIV